jgi:hypothetical protein
MRDGTPPVAPDARAGAAPSPVDLRERLAAKGRTLGERESPYRPALEEARVRCEALHRQTRAALEAFRDAAARAGAPHLALELSPPRLDEKHVRAVEFEVRRGRHVGLVVVKARGDVTFVGPFRTGKAEGPCRSLPADDPGAVEHALGEFLEQVAEEAATP